MITFKPTFVTYTLQHPKTGKIKTLRWRTDAESCRHYGIQGLHHATLEGFNIIDRVAG